MKTILIVLTACGLLFSGESTATYRVEGMMCAMNCPQKVNDSLNGMDGIKSCKVDFESKTAIVVFDDEKIDSDKIAKTIARGTYYKVMDVNKKEKSQSFWDWLFGNS
jgi:Cu+-exporting ATPase